MENLTEQMVKTWLKHNYPKMTSNPYTGKPTRAMAKMGIEQVTLFSPFNTSAEFKPSAYYILSLLGEVDAYDSELYGTLSMKFVTHEMIEESVS